MPWVQQPAMQATEECRVSNVMYVVGPPSLCVLKLEIIVGPLSGHHFSLRYRDIGKVVFIFYRSFRDGLIKI
jgi:hypothetical protein